MPDIEEILGRHSDVYIGLARPDALEPTEERPAVPRPGDAELLAVDIACRARRRARGGGG
ncbi:hypothetical protein [Roseomonas gilardii]|uniref:hypothetical protein n=1 Tax=Roseomonas gilardii TaxID=257708 RepID=UPI00056AB497|nr:hypothetical protein [Roseomonas gilardii]